MTGQGSARARFDDRFPGDKPVLAMLHLKGEDEQDRLSRARTEIDVLLDAGVDALVVENYFGTVTESSTSSPTCRATIPTRSTG